MKKDRQQYDLDYKRRIVQEYLNGTPADDLAKREGLIRGQIYKWRVQLERRDRIARIETIAETEGVATDDEDFERTVTHYMKMGMPKKHHLSVDAYRAKCRRAWDACKTNDQYKTKILLDELSNSFTVSNLGEDAYFDEATWRSLVGGKKRSKTINCIAIGRVPFVANRRGTDSGNHRAPRHYLSGTDLWMVALFDVLGFEAAYRRLGIEKLYGLYQQLIDKVVLKPSIDSFSTAQRMGDVTLANYFRLWVGFHYFSDTILLWCPATPENISPFLTRCSDLFIEALEVGLPLRGAVSLGEANFNKAAGIFIGQALIDCARLESSQNWLGVALSKSCSGILEHIDSDLVLPYTPPIKPTSDGSPGPILHTGVVLDWPRRARGIANLNVTAAIHQLNTSQSHCLYYDNAIAFLRHSAENARWNRDEKILIIFGALRNAIVGARLANRPFPGWAGAMIQLIESQKEYGRSVGDALRRATTEKLSPAEIERLPSGPRQFLTEVESIVDGRGIDLQTLAIATVEARFGICALDSYHQRVLDRPEDSKHIQSSLYFLRALLSDKAVPDIPDVLSSAERQILSMARTLAGGESLPIEIENFLAAIMYSASTGSPLESADQKRLAFVAAKGEPWSHLADAIKSVLAGEPIHVPSGMLPSEVATTVQVLQTFVAGSRREFHDAERAIARVQEKVDVDLIRRLVECLHSSDDHAGSDELLSILATMEASGHPHDAVARFVRQLMTASDDIGLPGGLPGQAHWFLRSLIRMDGLGNSAVPIDLIAGMIGNARARRAGNDGYGLALLGTLMSDEGEGLRLREFFETLVSTLELPSIPEDVSDDTRRSMKTILRLVQIEDAWIELRDLANAVADGRLSGARLDHGRAARIEEFSDSEEPHASFAKWLRHLASVGSEELALPSDLPEHITDRLDIWRLKCIARCSFEEVTELRHAAVRCRLQREKFSQAHKRTLAALAAAGGIYAKLATFIQKMSKPHAMPPVPMGLPPGLLGAFASARREALWQEGAGVFLRRGQE